MTCVPSIANADVSRTISEVVSTDCGHKIGIDGCDLTTFVDLEVASVAMGLPFTKRWIPKDGYDPECNATCKDLSSTCIGVSSRVSHFVDTSDQCTSYKTMSWQNMPEY